jgi:p-hydroxybenzoate 3-monooxygenase
MGTTRTQVGIIGAGPAGLLLGHLLRLAGVDSVVLERRSRDYVERRVRAGVLEHQTAQLLREVGVGARMDAEGLAHDGIVLRFDGADHHLDFTELLGRSITVYGQQEVVKDLIAARTDPIVFEVDDVRPFDLETDQPRITYLDSAGNAQELRCDLVAGCDGYHGVARGLVPATTFWREYPFAWLGILAHTPPSHHEVVYARSERGFALHSMRSRTLTRLYLQVDPTDTLDDWSDDRIWSELDVRLAADGFALRSGPILERGITPMRSVVVEPMRHRRLFLAGDAAHIVPPTGAKGMNLAVADVQVLARAMAAFFATGSTDLLDAYGDTCLRRVWRAEHFSWWMTSMLHRTSEDPFEQRLQLSQLRYVVSSRAAAVSLAENYVGLPI